MEKYMQKLLNRVPEITLYFWIIKILATTVGETAADYLSATLNLGLSITSYIMSGLLVIALLNQFRLKRYVPGSYWFVVVLTSVVGTLITDRLVDELGVTLVTTAIAFGIILLAVFVAWYLSTPFVPPNGSCFIGRRFYLRLLWALQPEIC
jgi:uncharacterized membrane-anchored protein